MNQKNNQDFLNLNTPLRFSLKNAVIIILFLIGVYFLVPKLVGLEKALLLLAHINKFYLVLALVAEFACYASAAILLGIIFSRMGYKLSFLDRYKLGSIAAFTIHFLPIGAAGEAVFEYAYLRKRLIDSGSIVVMWILRWIFSYSGFFILFLIGLVLLPIAPKLSFSSEILSPLILIFILSFVGYVIYLYKHKEKFWRVWTKLFSFVNKILARFKKNQVTLAKQTEIFEDIYQGVGLFSRQKRSSGLAILAGILYWLGDMTCLYFVFLSFGFPIHIGILIFGYCIATLLGILSAIPGGIGVTEGAMTLIFTSMGVPAALALTVVLVFRLFSFWIWIPIGFFSFLSLNKSRG